jgi:hypothetical protein
MPTLVRDACFLQFLVAAPAFEKGIKIVLQPSPNEPPCEMSTRRDLEFVSHQQQQDHMVNPLKIRWAWTSNEEMEPTQLPLAPSESPPQLFCSPLLINECHLWKKVKGETLKLKVETRYYQFKSTKDIRFTFFMIVVVKGEDNLTILNHDGTFQWKLTLASKNCNKEELSSDL